MTIPHYRVIELRPDGRSTYEVIIWGGNVLKKAVQAARTGFATTGNTHYVTDTWPRALFTISKTNA